MLVVRSRWPRVAAFLLATALACAVAHGVYQIPIQVSDSLDVIVVSRHIPSTWSLLADAARWSTTTLRPMRYVQALWLSRLADATGFSYHAVFRGTHAVLAAGIVLLFAWVANPRRWLDTAALAFGLAVLIGLHTFGAMLHEAFPVNHYAEIAAGALFIVGCAQRRPRALAEGLMLLLLIGGLLLIESAVLLWVVIAGCAVLKLPGMRPRTAVVATVILLVYLGMRPLLGIGTPGVGSHDSGFGAAFLSADELKARFGANPWPFHAYNVGSGLLSLLASEPRYGQYRLLLARDTGSLSPVVPLHVISSLLLTILVAAYTFVTLRRPYREWSPDARLTALAAAVVGVSAGLCLTYIKDEILSTAGVFYALATYLAVRWALDRVPAMRALPLALAACCLLVAGPLWTFRAVGTHYSLKRVAFVTRNDWALEVNRALAAAVVTPDDAQLIARVRREALARPVTSPSFLPDWGERYWIE